MGVELVGFSFTKMIGKPPQRNRELNNENREGGSSVKTQQILLILVELLDRGKTFH